PWVRSTTLHPPSATASPAAGSPPGTPLASRPAVPGAPSSSHSPGPEPITSTPSDRREARPKGTPNAPAVGESGSARPSTFASGRRSASRSDAVDRRPDTSQPATTSVGAAGAIGLLATGATATPPPAGESDGSAEWSATQPHPLRVDLGEMLHHRGPGGTAG